MTLEEIYTEEAEPYPLDNIIVMRCMQLAYNQALKDAYQVKHESSEDEFEHYTNKLEAILKLKKGVI